MPQQCVTAREIDRRANLPEGWTSRHTGVETRYECVAPETMISMGMEAIRSAMLDARLEWSQIDAIIDCSTSQFRPIPCNAAHFQQSLGADACSIPCWDIQSTCLGSIVAINMINGLFASKAYRNILLVASESAMSGVNWSQPESAGLIGDGAGAIILRCNPSIGRMGLAHATYSEHLELCKVEGGGHKTPVFDYYHDRRSEYLFYMDGPGVFRAAMKLLPPMVQRLLDEYRSHSTDAAMSNLHVVPHQASPRGLAAVKKLLGVPSDRFHIAVSEVGNLAAASLPWMIDRVRRSGAVRDGDLIMILGTSAGYSQAAMIFEL